MNSLNHYKSEIVGVPMLSLDLSKARRLMRRSRRARRMRLASRCVPGRYFSLRVAALVGRKSALLRRIGGVRTRHPALTNKNFNSAGICSLYL
jgi:hypothetical protein